MIGHEYDKLDQKDVDTRALAKNEISYPSVLPANTDIWSNPFNFKFLVKNFQFL